MGEHSAVFGGRMSESDEDDVDTRNEKGAAVFSSSWLPGNESKYGFEISSLSLSAYNMGEGSIYNGCKTKKFYTHQYFFLNFIIH